MTTTDAIIVIEELFEVEYDLRMAAIKYSGDRTDENRKGLRAAALAYGQFAAELQDTIDRSSTSPTQ